jgi:lipopolysaccharide heptosyltransferase I
LIEADGKAAPGLGVRTDRGTKDPHGKGSSSLITNSPTQLARLEPARVCIIKPSSMGDVVHALPILAALRERWPASHLTWIVNHSFQDVLRNRTDLDELIPFHPRRTGTDPSGTMGTAGLVRKLVSSHFDLTIDLQGLLRSALMTAATRAKFRLGMADAREGARWFYTDVIDAPRLGLHAVERTQRVAAALGADASTPRFNLPIREADREWAMKLLENVPSPRIVLNVGARWPTKRWPPGHFAQLGRRAVDELGAGLIAVGAAVDRPLVDQLLQRLGPAPVLDLCGQTRLIELAAVAAESDLVISNDTGPLHLAAAAGARVVGIYTCTDPKLTGPFGPRVATVQSCVWCAPSFIRKCSRLDCMAELTPQRVWRVVEAQLQQAIGA